MFTDQGAHVLRLLTECTRFIMDSSSLPSRLPGLFFSCFFDLSALRCLVTRVVDMLRAIYESCESGLSPTGVCGLSGSDMFAQPGEVTNRFSWKRNSLSGTSEDHKAYLVDWRLHCALSPDKHTTPWTGVAEQGLLQVFHRIRESCAAIQSFAGHPGHPS